MKNIDVKASKLWQAKKKMIRDPMVNPPKKSWSKLAININEEEEEQEQE